MPCFAHCTTHQHAEEKDGGKAYEVDHAVEVFETFLFEHSRVHVVFEVSVVDLSRGSATTYWCRIAARRTGSRIQFSPRSANALASFSVKKYSKNCTEVSMCGIAIEGRGTCLVKEKVVLLLSEDVQHRFTHLVYVVA